MTFLNKHIWDNFLQNKTSFYALKIFLLAYLCLFLLPVFVNSNAILVRYNNEYHFPAIHNLISSLPIISVLISDKQLDLKKLGLQDNKADNYFELQKQFDVENNGDFVLMPLYPYNPFDGINDEYNNVNMPCCSSAKHYPMHILGTDKYGKDVFAVLIYGLRISITFAFCVTFLQYFIGISIGATLGYFGGKIDILFQRFIEIWQTLPFIFLIIILLTIIKSSFLLIVVMLSSFLWVKIAILIRAEYYKEKNKDYVALYFVNGFPNWKILLHILPNALVPVIAYVPFSFTSALVTLTALDFIGFGLSPDIPSLSRMLSDIFENIMFGRYWLVWPPLITLSCILIWLTVISNGLKNINK